MRMRLDQAVRNLCNVKTSIDEFDSECEEREHTDVGEVWDLLNEVRDAITHVEDSWDNG